MQESNWFFTALAATLFLVGGLGYLSMTYSKEGTYPHWIPAKIALLDATEDRNASKKIIIASGSNAQFGIDSLQLEKLTNRKVLNVATHGGMDFNFYTSLVSRYISEDDLVVLPLEFNHYERQKITDVYARFMSLWGAKYLDLNGMLEFANSVESFNFIKQRLLHLETHMIETPALVARLSENQISKLPSQSGNAFYDWRSLTLNGEFVFAHGPSGKALILNEDYGLPVNVDIEFVAKFKRLLRIAERAGAKLMLTYPATMRNFDFDLYELRFQKHIHSLRSLLTKENIDIHCNAADFHFSQAYFLNTRYHLNARGVALRTVNLATCINQFLDGTPADYSSNISDAYHRTSRQQMSYLGFPISEEASQYNIRSSYVFFIREVLQAYRENNGVYPSIEVFRSQVAGCATTVISSISNQLIGSASKEQGRSVALAPVIHECVYLSDGLDFKFLLSPIDENAEILSVLRDPVRPDYAAGIWSAGARHW